MKWIEALKAAVPADYQIKTKPIKPGEVLLGPVPEDVLALYRAVRFARETISTEILKHHEDPATHDKTQCASLMATMDVVDHQTSLLLDTTREQLRLEFAATESPEDFKKIELELRTEGVVKVEKPTQEEEEEEPRSITPSGGLLGLIALAAALGPNPELKEFGAGLRDGLRNPEGVFPRGFEKKRFRD